MELGILPATTSQALAELEKGRLATLDAFDRYANQLAKLGRYYQSQGEESSSIALSLLHASNQIRRMRDELIKNYSETQDISFKISMLVRSNSWLRNAYTSAYSYCWRDMLKNPDGWIENGNMHPDFLAAVDGAIQECKHALMNVEGMEVPLTAPEISFGSIAIANLIGRREVDEYKEGLQKVINILSAARIALSKGRSNWQQLMADAVEQEDKLTGSFEKLVSSKTQSRARELRNEMQTVGMPLGMNVAARMGNFVFVDHSWVMDAAALATAAATIFAPPAGAVLDTAVTAYFSSKGLTDAAIGFVEKDWKRVTMGVFMAATPGAKVTLPEGVAAQSFGGHAIMFAAKAGNIAGKGMMIMSTADSLKILVDANHYGITSQDMDALAANGVFFGIGFVMGAGKTAEENTPNRPGGMRSAVPIKENGNSDAFGNVIPIPLRQRRPNGEKLAEPGKVLAYKPRIGVGSPNEEVEMELPLAVGDNRMGRTEELSQSTKKATPGLQPRMDRDSAETMEQKNGRIVKEFKGNFAMKVDGEVQVGEETVSLLKRWGIAKDAEVRAVIATLGKEEVTERLELAGASNVDESILRQLFATAPELLAKGNRDEFIKNIENIEMNRIIIDGMRPEMKKLSDELDYRKNPIILLEDTQQLTRDIRMPATNQSEAEKPPVQYAHPELSVLHTTEEELRWAKNNVNTKYKQLKNNELADVLHELGFEFNRHNKETVYIHRCGVSLTVGTSRKPGHAIREEIMEKFLSKRVLFGLQLYDENGVAYNINDRMYLIARRRALGK